MDERNPMKDERWKVINGEQDSEQYIEVEVIRNEETKENVECKIKDTSNDETSIFVEGQITSLREDFFYERI